MPALSVRTVSLVDAVAESLRLAIINSEYEPGSSLTEVRVSEDFGVARSTAKAAVERLVSAGFLERLPHRSAQIPLLTERDVIDLYETRQIIEGAAVRLSAASGTLPSAAEKAEAELISAAERGDRDAVATADVAFHTALVAAAGLRNLADLHGMLMGRAHIAMVQVQRRNPNGAHRSHGEHEKILAAIRDGDGEAAAQALSQHLSRAQEDFRRGRTD
ncbi:GntR family transcriptional regulator [Microbacterium sp. M28]|uniref:GntR family transcriptional regulator n=1 Tax=Microbacterium sp. M28 TaxID=2962064 RepID=UPI0021F485F3|nr:GntR family transcriptional regulator [Microbacterium sp. M28]UYO97386.1 GntR family transcriptional regulator [Microbacterium sp. M28]